MKLISVLLVVLVACKSPNPLNCADGTCNDPSYPFCDVDGTIGAGSPNTCVAIDCEPGSVYACRGNDALLCNADGNNLIAKDCEVGCEPGKGCVTCLDSSDCENPSPICDTSLNECRRCTSDDECPSLVCDSAAGTCADEALVMYVAPDGLDTTDCTLSEPCSMGRAFMLAAETRDTIRLLDGNYTSQYTLTSKTVTIVGNEKTKWGGAQIALEVHNGANATIRGVHFIGNSNELTCDSVSIRSALTLRSVTATGLRIVIGICDANIDKSTFDWTESGSLSAGAGAAVDVGYSRFVGETLVDNANLGLSTMGRSMRITNSTFENVAVGGGDQAPNGLSPTLLVAFNTFVKTTMVYPGAILCGPYDINPIIENNIIHSNDTSIYGASCAMVAQNNILFPQMDAVPASNLQQDPMLTNPTPGGDFSLRAGSPAIDRAVPTQVTGTPTTDVIGTPRPQGPKHDIGAYEFKP